MLGLMPGHSAKLKRLSCKHAAQESNGRTVVHHGACWRGETAKRLSCNHETYQHTLRAVIR
jgi:hypothetical protein